MRHPLAFLFLAGLLPASAFAQSDEEVLAEFAEQVNTIVNQATNAITLFSSQESVSSGYLRFKSDPVDGPDSKLEVLRLPLKFDLSSSPDAQVRPYVRGLFGYLKQTESVPPGDDSGETDDFSRLTTYSGEVGFGVEIEPFENFLVRPDFGVTYSRIENKYDYNNSSSQQVAPFIDGEVFNWDLDVMTYAPSVDVLYTLMVGDIGITPRTSATYFVNDSFESSSEILDIESESLLLQNGVEVLLPLGFAVGETPLGLRLFAVRSDVHGSAKDALGFSHFYETGSEVVFDVRGATMFDEVNVGFAYTFAEDLEGVRLGFGVR